MNTMSLRDLLALLSSSALHGLVFWVAAQIPSDERPEAPPKLEAIELVELVSEEPVLASTLPASEALLLDVPDPDDEATLDDEPPPPPPPPPPQAKPPKKRKPKQPAPQLPVVEAKPEVEERDDLNQPSADIELQLALADRAPAESAVVVGRAPIVAQRASESPTTATSKGGGASSKKNPRAGGAGRPRGSRPVPLTDIERELRRLYPREAQEHKIEGYARLELVVSRRGRPERMRIVASVGHPAFGDACRRAVERSRWRAGRDASGRRVATLVRYKCRFKVDA